VVPRAVEYDGQASVQRLDPEIRPLDALPELDGDAGLGLEADRDALQPRLPRPSDAALAIPLRRLLGGRSRAGPIMVP
jgi:hypothetical protein